MAQRILVVDDDPIVARSVARVLATAGFELCTASDVASALEVADQQHLDAAIVDYSLARETGLPVLMHLLETQPHCVRVLLTGHSEADIFIESVNLGEVAMVIRKPFAQDQLVENVKTLLARAERHLQTVSKEQRERQEAERRAVVEALRVPLPLALQPIFLLGGGEPELFAYEALMRPKHPVLNNPLKLIEAAERHQLIPEVGQAVFQRAARILQRLDGPTALFVNLHPHQLAHPERLAADLALLEGHTHRVVIEITEQSSLTDLERWEDSIGLITDSGCQIAVDDLGSGYSALSILADLQPAFIKLDMSLVRNLHEEPRRQRLVSLLRTFGDATDARVIAEGVESIHETRALMACGIELVQGYYFARPSLDYVRDEDEGSDGTLSPAAPASPP